jgi:general secretion pathway protein C
MQNGDVISRINGFDINSPDKALEIYGRLKEARSIRIEYERRGQSMSADYTIQ